MPGPTPRKHNKKGEFIRTLAGAERDARAAELREERRTYQEIAAELGFADRSTAWRAVQRALTHAPREAAEKLIAVESAQLDELYLEAMDVLHRDHLMVSHGRIVKDDNGEPLLDDGPKLAAIDRLVKIRESYRKLHGADQPGKVELSGGVRYEVVGVGPEDLT